MKCDGRCGDMPDMGDVWCEGLWPCNVRRVRDTCGMCDVLDIVGCGGRQGCGTWRM